jgi:hypothetical protein
MKKYVWLLVAIIATVGLVGMASAANPDTMDISVTITGATLSVDITTATWNVSGATGTTQTSAQIPVVNNSGGLTETYWVKGDTVTAGWVLGSNPGVDTFVLSCVIKGWDVGSPTFGAEDVVTYSYQACSSTVFGDSATNGAGVATGEYRGMWLQLKMPTSVTTTSGTLRLYVNAQ